MITKEEADRLLVAVAKSTWSSIPEILAVIPATAVAGKVLIELRKICEKAKASIETEEDPNKEFCKLAEQHGGKNTLFRELREEIKAEGNYVTPKYINCAIFMVHDKENLSEEEQEKLLSILTGELRSESAEIEKFVEVFTENYFCGDYDSCDNPIEISQEYVSFNFDDCTDHEYSEEDLKDIMEMLNKIVGREAFCQYEGFGTDDSVEEYLFGN